MNCFVVVDTELAGPNVNSYVSQLLSDYPDGIEIHALHALYAEHKPDDCPSLDFDMLCYMTGWCWAKFGSFQRVSREPLIIKLISEGKSHTPREGAAEDLAIALSSNPVKRKKG